MIEKHPFPPLFDKNSQILILGSFPSIKSREQMFFYGHPQNRFWKVISAVFDSPVPCSIPEKMNFCHINHIALWDVIASCDIKGSSDSSIRDVTVNNLDIIFDNSDIHQVFVNGKTAEKEYKKFIYPYNKRAAICMPSTSPANAAWSLERLIEAWSCIKNY